MYQFDKDLRVIMKLGPFLIGAISAQSGDDADRWDNTDFSLTDNIFTYEQTAQEKFDNSIATGCATSLVIQAVTCWESNHMGNLDHYVTTNDDGFGWKNIHHGHDQGGHSESKTSAGLRQGTQESTLYGKRVASSSPNYQIGTYSRGMVQGAVNKIDYHSAMAFDNRYSGCIYEAAGWDYDANSYNAIWRMSYGYDPTLTNANYLNDASGVDRSNNVAIRPNWWHYFNSHVLNVGMFDNAFDSYERHLLVMANPAYEGLGYLNWITTFAKYASDSEDHTPTGNVDDLGKWNAFAPSNINANDSSTGMNKTPSTDDNYSEGLYRGMINHNTHDTVTDLYSGGYAFHLGRGCRTQSAGAALNINAGNTLKYAANHDFDMNPEINVGAGRTAGTNASGKFWEVGDGYDSYAGTKVANVATSEIGEWYSYLINKGDVSMTDINLNSFTDNSKTLYPWMSMAAVSSFPHNDLGQDFRFNIRILHRGGRGFPYYFGGNHSGNTVFHLEGNGNAEAPGGLKASASAIGIDVDFPIHDPQIAYLAQDSYYWYKVNTIQIGFPSYVRCPRFPKNIAIDKLPASTVAGTGDPFRAGIADATLGLGIVREEALDDTFRCMDSANFNGHRGWNSATPYNHETADTYAVSAFTNPTHRPSENYPLYLEQLTENDGSKYAGILVSHDKSDDGTTTAFGSDSQTDADDGFICGDVPPFNANGGTDYKGEWFKCGQKYTVHGLMNTYDEHAQLEYGTMQEIWFQFWYHYVITFDTDRADTGVGQPGFWDKRDSNTHRADDTNNADWPTASISSPPILHDGKHDDVYFTMSNYKNAAYSSSSVNITYDLVHNFPNILFNAFELRGIRFFCDDINSFNSNTCFHTGQAYGAGYSTDTLIGDSMINP